MSLSGRVSAFLLTGLPVEVPIVIPVLQMKKVRLRQGEWVPGLQAVPAGASWAWGISWWVQGSCTYGAE